MANDPLRYFRVEARELADELEQGVIALERSGDAGVIGRLLRLAHTLKGAARVVRQPEIADLAHAVEEMLAPHREAASKLPRRDIESLLGLVDNIGERVAALQPEPAADSGTSAPQLATDIAAAELPLATAADTAELDSLLDALAQSHAELAPLATLGEAATVVRRMIETLRERLRGGAAAEPARLVGDLEELTALMARLEGGLGAAHMRIGRELEQSRDRAEQLRLTRAGSLFPALVRTARDVAQATGKEVVFSARGADVRLDAAAARLLQPALIQLVRNAVAHGIELPAQRQAVGKPAAGQVGLDIERAGTGLRLRISDDGKGIDVDALRQASGTPPDVPLATLMLAARRSTATELSQVAGRGVGMDVVRHCVEDLVAGFEVLTTAGAGTVFELLVPLKVAALPVLVLEAGEARLGVPLGALRAVTWLDAEAQRTAETGSIVHNGAAVPLVLLDHLLGATQARRRAARSVLIFRGADGATALGVERLLGVRDLVVRPLPEHAAADPLVNGAALDAAGRPLLLLDPAAVAARADASAAVEGATATRPPLLVIDDSLTTRMLEQSILESAGYEVEVAKSAEEGLERARAGAYGLILVDVEMPGMDGFAFIEHIRRDPRLRHTPAILVTSRNAPEDKRRGEVVGAQGYVVKSEFDQAALLQHIERLLA